MANHVLIVTDEVLARIKLGLGEIAAKYAVPVFQEIEAQVALAETGGKNYIDAIESHIAAIKAKVEKVVEKVQAEVADVKTVVADVEKAL